MEKFILFKKDRFSYALPVSSLERVEHRNELDIEDNLISPVLGSKGGKLIAYCIVEHRNILLPIDEIIKIIDEPQGYYEIPERVKNERNKFINAVILHNETLYFALDINSFSDL